MLVSVDLPASVITWLLVSRKTEASFDTESGFQEMRAVLILDIQVLQIMHMHGQIHMGLQRLTLNGCVRVSMLL